VLSPPQPKKETTKKDFLDSYFKVDYDHPTILEIFGLALSFFPLENRKK